MAASFTTLPPECLELILCYLDTPDLISLSLASPTVGLYVTSNLPRLTYIRRLKKAENKSLRFSCRLETTSTVKFTQTSAGAKLQSLCSLLYHVLECPTCWRPRSTVLVITKNDSEAHQTATHLNRSGFRALLSHGYPSRHFLDQFMTSSTKDDDITIAVTSRIGGRWGHWKYFWPVHVVSLNPPESLQDYLTIETFGGKWTWTFYTTSSSDLLRAWKLICFLQSWQPHEDGRGTAAYSSHDCLDESRNLRHQYPHRRVSEARRLFSSANIGKILKSYHAQFSKG